MTDWSTRRGRVFDRDETRQELERVMDQSLPKEEEVEINVVNSLTLSPSSEGEKRS